MLLELQQLKKEAAQNEKMSLKTKVCLKTELIQQPGTSTDMIHLLRLRSMS